MDKRNREFERLMALLTEGQLSAEQFHRLDEILASDPKARAAYHQQLQMHTLLLFGRTPVTPPAERPETADDFLQYLDLISRQQATHLGKSIAMAPLRCDPPSARMSLSAETGRRSLVDQLAGKSLGYIILASMIPVFILAAVGISSLIPHPDHNEIVASKNLEITEKAAALRSITLKSGTATVAIDKVGSVILEGPANFDLISPTRARFGGRGKLRMRVTEKTGRGFVIETPRGEVTDLGTEFGLDLSDEKETGLIVFEGMVDLRVSGETGLNNPQRLVEGEAVVFGHGGKLDRINSILTGTSATFQRAGQTLSAIPLSIVISNVIDNERSLNSKKFYEIVAGGLREDALAYVDRPHQWNGISEKGMPAYLLGADYVKTFNEDKLRNDLEIEIMLGRPARLFVFYDDRLKVPSWLRKTFRDTGDKIGQDLGRWPRTRLHRTGIGPGNDVELSYSVWERVVTESGIVHLGPNMPSTESKSGMYGIAAVALEPEQAIQSGP